MAERPCAGTLRLIMAAAADEGSRAALRTSTVTPAADSCWRGTPSPVAVSAMRSGAIARNSSPVVSWVK